MICFNCGVPDHIVGLCSVPKACFICKTPEYHMDTCLAWCQPLPIAQYQGNAANGLGVFHIEVEKGDSNQRLNFLNIDIVIMEEGEVSEEELKQNFFDMWKNQLALASEATGGQTVLDQISSKQED